MPSGIFKHSYKQKTRESLPIAVYNSGVQQCEPGYTWGPGVRDHFLVHHVVSGRGTYTAGDGVYPVLAGDTFLVRPGQVARYSADEEDPWEYCWVGFNGAEAKVLIARTAFAAGPVARFAAPDAIRDAITAIYAASGTTQASELRTIGLLYEFLALLIEQSDRGGAAGDLSLEYVEAAVRFIARNYSRPIDVSDVAASVGISRSHLYRVFMRHIAASPNDYLTRFRITQACELLGRSSLPVAAVAASVGYDDSLYFSRVFKKCTGLSPTAYQKQARGGTKPETERNLAL